jgi:hypothetical protein
METSLYYITALLAVLDVVAGVVTFIWLIVLGEWWAIGYGFGVIPATVALIFLAKPGAWMRVPAMVMIDRRQSVMAYLFHLASRLFEAAVAAGWFAGVIFLFSRITSNFSFWPLVVWGYALALAAWTYMSRYTRKIDTGDIGSDIMLLSVQLAFVAIAVLIVGFALRPPLRLMQIFAAITFAGAFIASIAGFIAQKKRAALGVVYAREPHP